MSFFDNGLLCARIFLEPVKVGAGIKYKKAFLLEDFGIEILDFESEKNQPLNLRTKNNYADNTSSGG